MEKYLMTKFKEILEQEKDITDIDLFYNLEGHWVISYIYNNENHLINIEEIL